MGHRGLYSGFCTLSGRDFLTFGAAGALEHSGANIVLLGQGFYIIEKTPILVYHSGKGESHATITIYDRYRKN